jgi:CBS domain containing-hemolysin-like protein
LSPVNLLVFYVFIALSFSFVCSVLEAVLLSLTSGYVQNLQKQGKKSGELLEKLRREVEKPLSAILSLNTIANTIGAAGVGAQASVVFGSGYVGLVSGILTLLILIFSEIIPKTIGAKYWKKIAPIAAYILPVMIVLLYPLVFMALQITRLISKDDNECDFSREEFSAITEVGAKAGLFEKHEIQILNGLLKFKTTKVKDILTPRTVVFALDEKLTVEQCFQDIDSVIFSRIPVFDENIDDITGYVLKDDILLNYSQNKKTLQLKDFKRDIVTVLEFTFLPSLLEQLIKKRDHIALVVDEYGQVEGIVTLEDAVEEILGLEIMDEMDKIEDMREFALEKHFLKQNKLTNTKED